MCSLGSPAPWLIVLLCALLSGSVTASQHDDQCTLTVRQLARNENTTAHQLASALLAHCNVTRDTDSPCSRPCITALLDDVQRNPSRIDALYTLANSSVASADFLAAWLAVVQRDGFRLPWSSFHALAQDLPKSFPSVCQSASLSSQLCTQWDAFVADHVLAGDLLECVTGKDASQSLDLILNILPFADATCRSTLTQSVYHFVVETNGYDNVLKPLLANATNSSSFHARRNAIATLADIAAYDKFAGGGEQQPSTVFAQHRDIIAPVILQRLTPTFDRPEVLLPTLSLLNTYLFPQPRALSPMQAITNDTNTYSSALRTLALDSALSLLNKAAPDITAEQATYIVGPVGLGSPSRTHVRLAAASLVLVTTQLRPEDADMHDALLDGARSYWDHTAIESRDFAARLDVARALRLLNRTEHLTWDLSEVEFDNARNYCALPREVHRFGSCLMSFTLYSDSHANRDTRNRVYDYLRSVYGTFVSLLDWRFFRHVNTFDGTDSHKLMRVYMFDTQDDFDLVVSMLPANDATKRYGGLLYIPTAGEAYVYQKASNNDLGHLVFDHLFRAFVRPSSMAAATECFTEGMALTLKALSLEDDGMDNGYCFGEYIDVIQSISCASQDKVGPSGTLLQLLNNSILDVQGEASCHALVYWMLEQRLPIIRSVMQTIRDGSYNLSMWDVASWQRSLESALDDYCTQPTGDKRCRCFDGYELQGGRCVEGAAFPCLQGQFEFDACSVCAGDNSTCTGCDGVLHSGLVVDACGVCGGNNGTCTGCDGVVNSGLLVDACGVCGGFNVCVGCDGQPWSNLTTDACGMCGGDNSTCTGCDGLLWSNKTVDACGRCAGDGQWCRGCDGVLWSNKTVDRCGVCGGDDMSCVGCDGVLNSGLVMDACEVCAGDNSTCAGCDGVPNSGNRYNDCGTCGDLEEYLRCQQEKSSQHQENVKNQRENLRDVALQFLGASMAAIGLFIAMGMGLRWLRRRRSGGWMRLPTQEVLP